MNLKMLLLYSKFENSDFFVNLTDYLKDKINENKFSYDTLKYLYSELYHNHSLYVKQNIYPVGEFLSRGFSYNEAEKIANLLPDASKHTIFSYDKNEFGYKYNKLFKDLQYAYYKYEKLYDKYNSKEQALEKLKNVIGNTNVNLREKFCKEINNEQEIKQDELEI